MNVYFSCSLTGGRLDQVIYGQIVDHLVALGHTVPTAHLASPDIMNLERTEDPHEIYERDMAWIRECDVLIAEVSTPSHGVGYEVAFALSLKKPVLCCYRDGAAVSKMITGNDSPGMVVRAYRSESDALTVVDEFLEPTAHA
ncbi:MAG: nucleoside 2-deoxyribosyltransferase [Anaerolineales bacterium]